MEGDPGTRSHCGSKIPHPAHTPTAIFPEGPHSHVQCNGTVKRAVHRIHMRVYKTQNYVDSRVWCLERTWPPPFHFTQYTPVHRKREYFYTWRDAIAWALRYRRSEC